MAATLLSSAFILDDSSNPVTFVFQAHQFTDAIFNNIADGSIELLGLPLWKTRDIDVFNYSTGLYEKKIATVYIRIFDLVPWINTILSKRCGNHTELHIDCKEPMFFSKSCGI